MAKMIVVEVIVCYLGMLCKWKIAVLAWFTVFQVQYEVFIDKYGVTRKITREFREGFVRFTW